MARGGRPRLSAPIGQLTRALNESVARLASEFLGSDLPLSGMFTGSPELFDAIYNFKNYALECERPHNLIGLKRLFFKRSLEHHNGGEMSRGSL